MKSGRVKKERGRERGSEAGREREGERQRERGREGGEGKMEREGGVTSAVLSWLVCSHLG